MIICYFIMILYLQMTWCGHSPGNIILLVVAEGETVLLPINQTDVAEISWILNENHIATSIPEKPINVKNRKLKGLINSTDDGSLTITNVTRGNQGTYTANIFKHNENYCTSRYRLKVYPKLSDQDIDITVNVTKDETCRMRVTCGLKGSNVSVFWSSDNGTVLPNQTLDLHEIHPSVSYKCIAENPANRVFKALTPWTHCQQDTIISGMHSSFLSLITVLASITGVIIVMLLRKKSKILDSVSPLPEIVVDETYIRHATSGPLLTIYAEIVKQDKELAAISSGSENQEDLPISTMCNGGQIQTFDYDLIGSQSERSTSTGPHYS